MLERKIFYVTAQYLKRLNKLLKEENKSIRAYNASQ